MILPDLISCLLRLGLPLGDLHCTNVADALLLEGVLRHRVDRRLFQLEFVVPEFLQVETKEAQLSIKLPIDLSRAGILSHKN